MKKFLWKALGWSFENMSITKAFSFFLIFLRRSFKFHASCVRTWREKGNSRGCLYFLLYNHLVYVFHIGHISCLPFNKWLFIVPRLTLHPRKNLFFFLIIETEWRLTILTREFELFFGKFFGKLLARIHGCAWKETLTEFILFRRNQNRFKAFPSFLNEKLKSAGNHRFAYALSFLQRLLSSLLQRLCFFLQKKLQHN